MIQRPEKWRVKNGCRLLDPKANAAVPIDILGQKDFLDHCPGYIVDSPYAYSVYELERITRAGLSLGNALDLPYPVTDSIAMLSHARDLERAFRRREEERLEKERNGR